MRTNRHLLPGAALLALAALTPAAPPVPGQEPESPVVARGRDSVLSRAELDPVLLDRFAYSARGKAALQHLVRTGLVKALGAERGIVVTEDEVRALWDELDRRSVAAGEKDGLRGYLRQNRVSLETFVQGLKLSIMQERMTRAALGMPPEAEVTSDQQQIWIDQEIAKRGLEMPPRPWPDDVVARCEDVVVRADELADLLYTQLPNEELQETCWHILLVRRIEERMPDLAASARQAAVEREIDRRRREAATRPGFEEVPFEDVIGAEGLTLEILAREPSVAIAALSRLWVERRWTDAGLRELYQDERAFFEGRFGRAVRTRAIFLRAANPGNELIPRTYDQANAELSKLKGSIASMGDFDALARRYSEDPGTREKGGLLGWVTRQQVGVPQPLCAAVFGGLDPLGMIPLGGHLVGPFQTVGGCALLWLEDVREGPSWEAGMREHVHSELRRRFLEDVLPQREVQLVYE
jgi:hypothetical protein